jgi:hypothetical protein
VERRAFWTLPTFAPCYLNAYITKDAVISRECSAVPMDAATRAALIDLMARVLVTVLHQEGRRDNDRGLVQSQNQTGASGSQGDRLPSAIQRQTSTTE